MKEYALIVAGGSGKRMNSHLPKQFLVIAGKPILMYTIEAFHSYSKNIDIILVLPDNQHSFWKKLCDDYDFQIRHKVVTGGHSRFQSVKNGLNAISASDSLVAIHDGVRPLIEPEIIKASYESANKYGSGIAATKLKESIREKLNDITIARNRENYFSVQTPQTFHTGQIKKAYKVDERPIFTDDATVAECAGIPIKLVEGDFRNVKITTPDDVIIAEAMVLNKKK